MSTIGNRFKSILSGFVRFTPKDPPEKYGAGYFYPISTSGSTWNDLDLLKDYQQIPEVSAIVSKKAKAFSKMRLIIVSRSTGEPMKNYQDNIKVLRDPNWFQSQKEFLVQSKMFREVFGREYIYLNYPFGYSPMSSKAMFTLPPYMIKTETPQDKPFFMYTDPEIVYKFVWGNDEYIVPKENIIHFNDNRIDVDKKNWVQGQSWLSAQRAPVNNIRAAYEARGVLIENRGALGILANRSGSDTGAIPMSPADKQALQDEMRGYGMAKNKLQFILTNFNLDWKQISIDDPSKLGLFQEVQEDFYRLCDAAGVPAELFSSVKGTTFENQKTADRRLYEDTIIPESEEWIGGLNSTFETEKRGWAIVGSFNHLNVFQENMKERGDAINRLMTGLRIALDAGAIDQEVMKQELRKFGIVIP